MTNFSYIGSELDLFALASNWKSYYRKLIAEYLDQDVLEVGAGIGGTTKTLCDGSQKRWVCLEPDPSLAARIASQIENNELPSCCESKIGSSADLPTSEKFDSILYIDVLEHIEDDKAEIETVRHLLKKGGYLIVLSPAHQNLYTPFDKKIGHYRRYSKKSLSMTIPQNLKLIKLIYVDSVGALASLGNRYILKSADPKKKQILFWDKNLVPFSRFFDPLLNYTLGKTVIGVWQNSSQK